MPTIFIPAPLRELTGGVQHIEVDAGNMREVIRALERHYPGIADRLVKGDTIAPGLAVSIDGSISSRGLLAKVEPQSEVHFLPAIGGG